MKVILITIVMILLALVAEGQDINTHLNNGIKISYNYHYFTVRGYEVERPMILIADQNKSKFYNPMTDWIDSLNSTPEGKAKYLAIRPESTSYGDNLKSLPFRWEKMYVEKNRVQNTLKRYDTVGDDRFSYEENLSNIEWEICDSIKTIMNYDCYMARAEYHGREWIVWFSDEIPIQDGPWKLYGLPGIILEAKDTTGQYHFIATGIESNKEEIPPVYEKEKYEKIDRIELLRHKRFFDENLGIIITAQTNIKHLRPNQFRSLELNTNLDYLETDYH